MKEREFEKKEKIGDGKRELEERLPNYFCETEISGEKRVIKIDEAKLRLVLIIIN